MTPTTRPTFVDAIDVNVHVGRWPFRRLPLDETPNLVERLKSLGITSAWAGTFDALLHRDISSANVRLVEECATHGKDFLVPFGAINPALPDWEEDLRRCRETFRMPGIRLYPGYHGYKLDDPNFARLLDLTTRAGMVVQLVATMEDERMQHPLVRVPTVDLMPLPAVMANMPRAKVVLLNAVRQARGPAMTALAKCDGVSFETGVLEGVGGVSALLEQIPAERVLFGTHSPFLYPEAAVLKFQETPPLPDGAVDLILRKNAKALRGER